MLDYRMNTFPIWIFTSNSCLLESHLHPITHMQLQKQIVCTQREWLTLCDWCPSLFFQSKYSLIVWQAYFNSLAFLNLLLIIQVKDCLRMLHLQGYNLNHLHFNIPLMIVSNLLFIHWTFYLNFILFPPSLLIP